MKGVWKVEIDTKSPIVTVKYDGQDEKIRDKIEDRIQKIKNVRLLEYVKPDEKPVEVEQIKLDPEIDKFLNIEDESIFDEKFMDLSVEQIHPRSKGYYIMVSNIYKLNNLSKEMSDLKYEQTDEAKEILEQVSAIIYEINSDEHNKSFLSESQKKFCINLANRFNKFYE
jgi:hypothetical protein